MIEEVPVRALSPPSVWEEWGRTLLDLNYEEDSNAEVDMNVVVTGDGKFVEIQGTGGGCFYEEGDGRADKSCQKGIRELTKIQKKCLETK